MATLDDMSALEAAMDQEAMSREIAALEARTQNRPEIRPRDMQDIQARLTALRETLRAAAEEANFADSMLLHSNLQQPSASSYPQQPSAASYPQQASVESSLQQPSAASYPQQQASLEPSLQQPSATLYPQQQASLEPSLQQPSLQQPSAASNPQQQASLEPSLQQPSAASYPQQQASVESSLQQPSAASNPQQQASLESSLQQPSAASYPQQASIESNLQQSAGSSLEQPNAAMNLEPNIGMQEPGQWSVLEDPVTLKLIQRRLLLFLHGHNCQLRESQANGEQKPCFLPHCQTIRNVLNHMSRCKAGRNCTVAHCASSRQFICHLKQCARSDCPTCGPLKRVNDSFARENEALSRQGPRRGSNFALGIVSLQTAPQEHLLLYLHAQDCMRRESVANGTEECSYPFCIIMKDILGHMPMCQDGMRCRLPYCASTRQVIGHWNNCHRSDCYECAPLKKIDGVYRLQNKVAADNILVDLELLVDAEFLQSLNLNEPAAAAAEDSQSSSSSSDVAGAETQDGDHHSLSAIAAIHDMQKRLYSMNGSLPVNPRNIVYRTSPFIFHTDDIVPNPSHINLPWHQNVPTQLRQHLIKRLVQTLIRLPELPSVLDGHVQKMVLYSQNIESNFFESAESMTQYYHLLAEKIYKLEMELERRCKKHKERVDRIGQLLETGTAIVPGPNTYSIPVNPQVDSMSRPQRSRQTASSRLNPLQSSRRRRQSPAVPVGDMLDQPQVVSLQVDSFLSSRQQQQLREWYTNQRLLLLEKQQMQEQTVPSTSGYIDANDFSTMSTYN